jgi:hypothetical protein
LSRQVPLQACWRVTLGVWATAAICLVAAALLAGCGTSAASTAHTRLASPPSLNACVQRWNDATLGEGTETARLDAFKGTSALMVGFPDGACGLVFPKTKAAEGEKQRAPLVDFLDSNWSMGFGPLGSVSSAQITLLESDATNLAINISVRKSNGHVRAHRGASIFFFPANVFTEPPDGCVGFVDKSNTYPSYEIVRNTVACAVARALGWAWPERQQSTERAGKPTSAMRVIGWRCVGSALIRGLSPTTYEKIICTRRKDVVELRNLERQTLRSSPPGG